MRAAGRRSGGDAPGACHRRGGGRGRRARRPPSARTRVAINALARRRNARAARRPGDSRCLTTGRRGAPIQSRRDHAASPKCSAGVPIIASGGSRETSERAHDRRAGATDRPGHAPPGGRKRRANRSSRPAIGSARVARSSGAAVCRRSSRAWGCLPPILRLPSTGDPAGEQGCEAREAKRVDAAWVAHGQKAAAHDEWHTQACVRPTGSGRAERSSAPGPGRSGR